MAVESPGSFNQASTYPAEQTRRTFFYNLMRSSGSVIGTPIGGVVGYGDLQMSAPVSGMTVNVATGEAIIPGSSSTTQSGYYCRASSSSSLSIAASNPSNPRIDLVCGTVDDSGYSGGANDWKLQVVTGTPTSGATLANLTGAPALPTSSLLIGYVLVPANATNIIAGDLGDHRPYVTFGPNIFNFVSGSVSTSAIAGNHYAITAGSPTITLPAPFVNARVRVTNYGSSSAASITHNASEVIYGLGLGTSGAATFPLAVPGATATLESDGTNWFITSGQQDSGWATPTFVNSWSGGQIRISGNVVRFRGTLGGGTSATSAFSVPATWAPSTNINWVALNPVSVPGNSGEIQVGTNRVVTPTGNVGFGISSDGLTYTVD